MTGRTVGNIVKRYLREAEWDTRENANTSKTFTGLVHYAVLEMFKEYALREVYPEEGRYHISGDIHIHDLPYAPFIGYCMGWSLRKLLERGLRTSTIVANPAKHLDSAVDHIANFLITAQHEWAGAQAFSYVDLYLAPFVAHERVTYENVRQQVQRLVYNLNFPSRIGSQTPFTNFTLVLDSVKGVLENPAIVGGKAVGTLEDYVEESFMVFKALSEVLLVGDAIGQPFTFPIPTLMITRDFDWNGTRWGEVSEIIWDVAARRGSWYFLNGINGVDPESVFAMCCRLTIDKKEILKLKFMTDEGHSHKAYGIWALPEETGSIGVVTINMPRLGFLSKGEEEKLYEMLYKLLQIARRHLINKRKRLERILRNGLLDLTITRNYLGHYNNHFSTIGLTGLPEFIANFTRDMSFWDDVTSSKVHDAIKIYERVLGFIRKVLKEYEEEDGTPYNVEETPAESAGVRFAMLDFDKFKEHVERREFYIPITDGAPFYSNSIVPYYVDIPIARRIKIEASVQKMFTGGVMMHIFLNEPPEPKALKNLVYRITRTTEIVYFSITPTQSVCPHCGWSAIGTYWECPRCGSKTEVWSRIVGYYRPISRWNKGRVADFMRRKKYTSKELILSGA